MELVCINYLSLKRSKSGFENILVILIILDDLHKQYPPEIRRPQQQSKHCMKISSFTIGILQNYIVMKLKLQSD